MQVSALKELASSKTSFVRQLKVLEIKLKMKDFSLKELAFLGSAKTTFAWYDFFKNFAIIWRFFFSLSLHVMVNFIQK